jgi:hypothetical protein
MQLNISDWSIITIGPGGFAINTPPVYVIPVIVSLVGVTETKQQNLNI